MREVMLDVRMALAAALLVSVGLFTANVSARDVADEPPSSPEALSLRLIKQKYSEAKVKGANPVVITTAPEKFAYAASIGIPSKFDRFDSCDVTAVLKVTSGTISVGVLTRDQQKFLSQVAPVTTSRKPKSVTMKVSPMKDAGEVLFSNAQMKDGVTSTVEVSKVSVGPCT